MAELCFCERDDWVGDNKIIAFAGKGGVGKTSLAALTVRLLTEVYPDARILAIDADPAVGLSTALGIEVKHTVNDIRLGFIDNIENGNNEGAVQILNDAHYEIADIIVETGSFSFLAIGRPESSGCYCKVNAYLKVVISEMSDSFDFVVIDGEAGIEQINRRVMEKVSHLILVSDASKKGIDVIKTIKEVADGLCMYEKTGAIINRVKNENVRSYIDTGDIDILGILLENDELMETDMKGNSLMTISENSRIIVQLLDALRKINIIQGEGNK